MPSCPVPTVHLPEQKYLSTEKGETIYQNIVNFLSALSGHKIDTFLHIHLGLSSLSRWKKCQKLDVVELWMIKKEAFLFHSYELDKLLHLLEQKKMKHNCCKEDISSPLPPDLFTRQESQGVLWSPLIIVAMTTGNPRGCDLLKSQRKATGLGLENTFTVSQFIGSPA